MNKKTEYRKKQLNFWHSRTQSARMPEIKNGRLSHYSTEHSKCNHMMTLGFQGLKLPVSSPSPLFTSNWTTVNSLY